ncbi:hypothetical protein ACFCV3_10065 [Kribbella sp. NPDC056345]|uniref:hypothetical protein n=1 Tax=Kribbella sp. NPDC056345 TaxID=3345789 RepID=UPI0035E229F8
MALRDRCGTLVTALSDTRPDWRVSHVPTGGLYLWVRLPSDDAVAAAEARQAGVIVSPGGRFFATGKPAAWLRLNFAATAAGRLG